MNRNRRKWTVYFLMDPRDFEIRYVGCTENLQARAIAHKCSARFHIKNPNWIGGNTRKQAWIAGLLRIGLEPIIIPFLTTQNWDIKRSLEEVWIRRLGLSGCDLLIGPKGRESLIAKGIIKPRRKGIRARAVTP